MRSYINIKKVTLFILLFCALVNFVPPLQTVNHNIESHGTFIITLICTDGILMVADSRAVYFNDKKEIIAYYEGSQKLFQYNKIGVAMAGQYGFDTTRFELIFNNFKKHISQNIPVKSFYSVFIKFVKKQLSSKDYTDLLKNQFLVCGYDQEKPIICWYDGTGKDLLKLSTGYKTNFKKDDNIQDVIKYIKTNNVIATIPIAKKIVQNIVLERNKKSVSTIGGEASILSIKPSGIRWLKLQNQYDYNSIQEYYNNFISGNIKMWYRSPRDSVLLRNGFDHFYNKKNH